MGLRRSALALPAVALMLASGCGDEDAATDTIASQTNPEPAITERAAPTDAEATEATTKPRDDSGGGDQFDSLGEAADFAEEVTGRPAPIPRKLDLEGGVDVYVGPDGDVQFTVNQGEQPVVLRYGNAIGFDGCELPPMKTIEVGKEEGLLGAYDVPGKKYVYEAIWPATPQRPVGALAISGLLSEDEILEQAEAIQKAAKAKGDGSGLDAC